MAYVNIPTDLSVVKNKFMFSLTKRQILFLMVAAGTGFPFYLLTKDILGTSLAATIMILIMLPSFMFGMYEKNGEPLEVVIRHMIQVLFIRNAIRVYETENLYRQLIEEAEERNEFREEVQLGAEFKQQRNPDECGAEEEDCQG